MKSDVVTLSKRGLEIMDVERSYFSPIFCNRSMQGRDSYRLDPGTPHPRIKIRCLWYYTGFETLKYDFSISFSAEIVFVWRSFCTFLGRYQTKKKKLRGCQNSPL